LPWGEVITALETGLADGQFNAPVLNTTFNFHEVTDYTTLTGHVYNSAAWLVSEDWYQSLTDGQQEAVVTSAREAIAIGHGMSAALATASWQESCETFKDCYNMPAEERERMADIARPAWKNWIVNDFGIEAEKVDAFLAEVKRVGEEVKTADMANYGSVKTGQ